MGALQLLRQTKQYLTYFGLEGLRVLAQEHATGAPHEFMVHYPMAPRGIWMRTHSSDLATFVKVLVEREYEFPMLSGVRTIVDAGANIGLASLFYASKFPDARIIAIEPEPENFALLCRNLRHLPNAICLQKALWDHTGRISLFDPGSGSWGFRTVEEDTTDGGPGSEMGQVDCISVSDLIDEYDLGTIDLLKIDVEGAEKEIFEHADDWIERVDSIVVELHDRFRRGCSKAFFDATAHFPGEAHRGENVLVFRSRQNHHVS